MNCHSVQFFGNLPRLFTFRANRLIIIRMNDLTQKSSNRLTREQEREASRYFGKHVTSAKAAVSLCFALLTAASPMLVGLRLWAQIPEIVETGLTAINGEDDSIPRAVLVFGLPGLMCVLTLISHGQLWLHQKTERLPPTPIRITGRWSIPVISVLLCSFWLARAAGEATEFSSFLPCLLAHPHHKPGPFEALPARCSRNPAAGAARAGAQRGHDAGHLVQAPAAPSGAGRAKRGRAGHV